ncbi:hypothetical protein Dda_4397 [Drechslerella dactyloides]|uniref:Enoyl-CoA hydratase n=1 Tax=Drechslerella dactyloides TaxID=74499 RepID=A0AAD6IWV9_DREDA|nr:hypothetical protein Dda_4397 [Drechslerella dactyloides]
MVSGQVICFNPDDHLSSFTWSVEPRIIFESWLYDQVYTGDDIDKMLKFCQSNATGLEAALQKVIATRRNPGSIIVVMERPPAWVIEEFALRPKGDWVHFIAMPHVAPETIELFIDRVRSISKQLSTAFYYASPLMSAIMQQRVRIRSLHCQDPVASKVAELAKTAAPLIEGTGHIGRGTGPRTINSLKPYLRSAMSVVVLNDQAYPEATLPKALNAICASIFNEFCHALQAFDQNPEIRVILLAGSERVFAAGGDIREMSGLSFAAAYTSNFLQNHALVISNINKPIIAAVGGLALGGGCELAMMADILYCTENAKFGQPEIKLGISPGFGGSQRLTRAIGKARAMEIILTGKTFSGMEAEKWGLAARTFADFEQLMIGALQTAKIISGYSGLALKVSKEVVNQSQELSLTEGLKYESRMFQALFGSQDKKIGMEAFLNKVKDTDIEWTHE